MSRHYSPPSCSKSERNELLQLSQDSSNPRLAVRAAIVLECIKGTPIKDIAALFSEREATVIKWRNRFADSGIRGLKNLPRGDSAGVFGVPFQEKLRETVYGDPPEGHSYWTGELLAETLNVPLFAVWRYLKKEGIRLIELRRKEPTPIPEPLQLSKTEPQQESASATEPSREEPEPEKAEKSLKFPIQIRITWSESAQMRDEKFSLELTARIKHEDEMIMERSVTLENCLPGAEDIIIETGDPTMEDSHQIGTGNCRSP